MITIADARRIPTTRGGDDELALPLGPDDALESVGPFVMIARHRIADLEPGALPVDADVRPHPHIGLAALSYVLEGAVTHRDSLGHRRELIAGDVGLTVAGRGVVHSERFERMRLLGGTLDMFQMLASLPDGLEELEPSFAHAVVVPDARIPNASVRTIALPDGRGALRFPTTTLLVDVSFDAETSYLVPDAVERALYVFAGELRVGDVRVQRGRIARLPTTCATIVGSSGARCLVFGGDPVGPRWMWWNYLHSSVERIEVAKQAWRDGRDPLPVGDTESFTPAPADGGRPLRRIAPRAAP